MPLLLGLAMGVGRLLKRTAPRMLIGPRRLTRLAGMTSEGSTTLRERVERFQAELDTGTRETEGS
jgi:hypothetical protein